VISAQGTWGDREQLKAAVSGRIGMCSLTIQYADGTIQPLARKPVRTHKISWSWLVPQTVETGEASAQVSCGNGRAATSGTFTVVAGWQFHTFSTNWLLDTGVAFDTSVVGVCPLFPGSPQASYDFSSADLTDHVKSIWIPLGSDPLNYRFISRGTVAGVINAENRSYTVTSGRLIENRIGQPSDSWYFQGSGPVTITGQGGTLVGEATFTDTSQTDSETEEFLFTRITSCTLN
jgi:hypothetical protein